MRFLLLFTIILLFQACNSGNCNVDGINIEAVVLAQAQKTGFPYCLVVQKALKKDDTALMQLIRFAYKTDDDSAIDHGIAFTEVSLKLGDDYMSNFISKQTDDHKMLIAKMFDTCMEYREPSLSFEKNLPKSLQLLKTEQ